MKIKFKKNVPSAMKLIVPHDGLIVIPTSGIVEVSAKCAVDLVKKTNDWEYATQPKAEEEVEEPETTTADAPAEKSERELLEEKVKSSSIAELKAMAKEAELPEEEWSKLSKKLLAEYLLKKFDEANDEENAETEE